MCCKSGKAIYKNGIYNRAIVITLLLELGVNPKIAKNKSTDGVIMKRLQVVLVPDQVGLERVESILI